MEPIAVPEGCGMSGRQLEVSLAAELNAEEIDA